MDILFRNADILTARDDLPELRGGLVAVEDGEITYVGMKEPRRRYERTIDCAGKILMPGLVNTHAHFAMTLMRGYADDMPLQSWLFEKVFPAEARLDRRAIVAGTRLAFAEMIASGTTSASDMYFHEDAIAETALEAGMRVSLSNGVIAFDNKLDMSDRSFRELTALIRDYHGDGCGLVRADASIHAEYTSFPDAWMAVRDIALEHGLVMQLHLSETEKEHRECMARYGMTPTAVFDKYGVFKARTVAAHGVWLTDEDMDILRKNRVTVAHCPVSNLKLGSGIARVTEMLARGVNVSLGTDGCCSNNTHDMFEEMKLASLLQKGRTLDPEKLSAHEAIKLATVNGARAQGREGQTGEIRAGLRADIILIDTAKPSLTPVYSSESAAVYSARGSDVALTMIDGKIVYENGEYKTVDIEKTLYEAREYGVPLVLGKD